MPWLIFLISDHETYPDRYREGDGDDNDDYDSE